MSRPTGIGPGVGIVGGGIIMPVAPSPLISSAGSEPPVEETPIEVIATSLLAAPGYSISSKTHIVNLAAMNAGLSKLVNNIETEQTPLAILARLVWDDERLYVLRDFPWPEARSYAALGLVSGTQTVPANNDWTYAYRYPADAVAVRRLTFPGSRTTSLRMPFRIGRDTGGKLILTDIPDAEAEYTVDLTDPTQFDPMFVQMFVWRLTARFAVPLSRIPQAAVYAMQMYEVEKSKAWRAALNESQDDPELESEFITARL